VQRGAKSLPPASVGGIRLSGRNDPGVVPDKLGRPVGPEEQFAGMLLVDMPDQAVIDRISDELLESPRVALDDMPWDSQLLVLLLAHETGAIVHGDTDAALVRQVRAATVPETSDPDEHASLGHLGRDRVVVLEEVR